MMSEAKRSAKHTPGPWRVGDVGHTVFGPPNGNPSPETIAKVRRVANARLIAAAPEMLAALQFVAECFRDTDSRIWDVARAAIAKATGDDLPECIDCGSTAIVADTCTVCYVADDDRDDPSLDEAQP